MEVVAGILVAASLGVAVYFWDRTRKLESHLAAGHDEVERLQQEIEALADLTYLFTEERESSQILEEVLDRVKGLLGVDGAAVAAADNSHITIAAATGDLAGIPKSIEANENVLLERCLRREQVQVEQSLDRPIQFLGRACHNVVVAPLQSHGDVFGAMAVMRRSAPPLSTREVEALAVVCGHTATALANKRFVELVKLGKDQWESTFDAMIDGVSLLDVHGRIVRANAAMARLLKSSVTEVIGTDLQASVFGTSGTLDHSLEQARGGTATPARNYRSGNLDQTLSIAVAPVGGGHEDLTVVLIKDVTQQQQLQAQLIQSDKMATIGQLVSGVAHELNNPLASIAGLSELLLEHATELPPNARQHLDVINAQANRASKIVENLLTFARHGDSSRHQVDINALVERTMQLVSYDLRQRGVVPEVRLDPDSPQVVADASQLQQVILNLLSNAYQALESMPDGERRVRVTSEMSEITALISVEDSGPGVNPEIIDQIFTPFFTTKDQSEGTGLGLSISYGIVEEHGGTLTAGDSPDLGGARFVMALPVA